MGIKFSRINESEARKRWEGTITKRFPKISNERLRLAGCLAETKMQIDGGGKKSEALLEAYAASTATGISGAGPVAWGSDPGTGVGALPGAWHRPNYVKGSGDIPSNIISMGMNIAAYTVGFDLVTTIPVDMPSVTYMFLDTIYGGGFLDKAGSAPLYIELAAPEITKTFGLLPNIAVGDNVFITQGTVSGTIVAGSAIQGIYMGQSLVNGRIIIKPVSTGTTTAPGVYTPAATSAALTSVLGATNLVARGTSATQITPAQAYLTTGLALDNVSAIRNHIAGASHSDGVSKDPMTRAVTEQGSTNRLNLRLWNKTLEMKGIEITGDVTRVQLTDLKAYGIDAVSVLYQGAQNQLIQTINDNIIDRIARLGVMNHAQLFLAQGVNLNLFIAPAGSLNRALTAFTGITEFADPTGTDRRAEFGNIANSETNSAAENLHTRQRRVYTRILASSNQILVTGRVGRGNIAVVNSMVSTALQDCANFAPCPMENSIEGLNAYKIGTIAGYIEVFCNPKWGFNDNRVVVGYKGTEDQPGVKFLAYDLASAVEIISPQSMAPQISIQSRYELIDAGFNPEAQYLTFAINSAFGDNLL